MMLTRGRLCAYVLSLPHISYITIAIFQMLIHLYSTPTCTYDF